MMNSTFMIQAIVILVTVKLFISTNTHTWYGFACYLSGVSWYFVLFLIESNIKALPLSGLMPMLYNFVTQYTLLFFIITGFILVDYGMQFVDIQVQQVLEELEQTVRKQEEVQVYNERFNRKKKLTQYDHKGFDFDGAAGHDILVMDKAVNRLHDAIMRHLSVGPSVFNVSELSGSIGSGLNSSERRVGYLDQRKEENRQMTEFLYREKTDGRSSSRKAS
jgi:hypothetical protein